MATVRLCWRLCCMLLTVSVGSSCFVFLHVQVSWSFVVPPVSRWLFGLRASGTRLRKKCQFTLGWVSLWIVMHWWQQACVPDVYRPVTQIRYWCEYVCRLCSPIYIQELIKASHQVLDAEHLWGSIISIRPAHDTTLILSKVTQKHATCLAPIVSFKAQLREYNRAP